jgi:MFS family permease
VIGIEMVGFIVIVYGVANSMTSYAVGKLGRKIGRVSIILSGGLLNLGIIISLLVWINIDCKPHATAVLFTAATLWGVVDAISNTQTVGLFGVLYTNNQEAAFGAYRLWQSIGFVVSFSYSDALRDILDTKLYIMLSALCISMIGYIVMELVRKKF